MFTQYKLSPVDISQRAVASAASLAKAMPHENAPSYAARLISDRLRADPGAYLQFGPYWWAVKVALFKLGQDFGPADDAIVRMEYGGSLPAYAALVAGEAFREFYFATFLAGSAQFWLDDDGEESYVLFDAGMEARRLGRAATDDAIVEDGEAVDPVLDDVASSAVLSSAMRTPFAVKFVMDSAMWCAEVYADDQAGAAEKVKAMQASGRIGRAVDLAKGLGQPIALDNTNYDQALFVDRTSRTVYEA